MQDEASQEAARRQAETLQRLRSALRKNDLVIIVGAGVTIAATADAFGTPLHRLTWVGLIRNGLDFLVKEGYVDASNSRITQAYESLKQNDPHGLLDAANIMADQMRKSRQFSTWLDSVFGNLSEEIRHPAILETLQELHRGGATLLTTNYDDLLEKVCTLRRVGRSNKNELLRFKRRDVDGVLHLHGSYHDPDEVVLDTTDYYRITRSEEIQNILRTFLEYKTMLFVGCGSGLEDPNFGALLKWAGDRHENIPNRHCLLVRNGDILNHQLLIRLRYGSQYENLAPFLRQLLDLSSQPTQPTTKIIPATIRNGPDSTQTTIPLLRNHDFVGRLSIFDELDGHLLPNKQSPRRAALCGLGGIGKTQIALEYAHRFAKNFACSTFWIHASSVGQFEESYQRIGHKFAIPGYQDPKADQLQLVRDWLESKHDLPWLMVIDNVDDGQVIYNKLANGKCLLEYLPQSDRGSVLYTSRNRDVGVDLVGSPIDVSLMDSEEALDLLFKKVKHATTAAEGMEFLEEMGFLPLAITQAAAYMSKRQISISQFLVLFRESDSNRSKIISHCFTDLGRESRPMESLAKTWTMSFEYIKDTNSRAYEILTLMSFLDRNAIPNSLLMDDHEEELDFLDAVAVLEAFSLVQRKSDSNVHDMHRLVQLATLTWIRKEADEDRWAALALLVLSRRFPPGEYEHWKTCAEYLLHADVILQHPFKKETDDVKTAKAVLLYNISHYVEKQGNYPRAVKAAEMSLELRKGVLGIEHRQTLNSMDRLANALKSQGDFRSAEGIARKTLDARVQWLGSDHEETLASSETLARVLFSNGAYETAQLISQQVVSGRTKIMGPEHRKTLSMVFFTGWALRYQNKFLLAKTHISSAFSVQKRTLGENHPDSLGSLGGLGILEMDLGNTEMAEKLLREVLGKTQQIFGADHPETHSIMNNLAVVLSQRCKHQEAEALNQKCLQWEETVLGTLHPETMVTRSNLAIVLQDQHKYVEAEALYRQTVAEREKVLGDKHPDTITSRENLASVLQNQNKCSEAEALYRQTIAEREKLLGDKHLDTLRSHYSLANVLRTQHKYIEAEALYRQTLAVLNSVLSERHLDVIRCHIGLVYCLIDQKQYQEAEQLCRWELPPQEDLTGIGHSHTAESMSALAFILQSTGRHEEARDLYSQSLVKADVPDCQGVPNILVNLLKIVGALKASGQFLEARDLAQKVLAKREELYGTEAIGTLMAAWYLGTVLNDLGEDAEALKVYQRAHTGFFALLGPSNKTSLTCATHWQALLDRIRRGDTTDPILAQAIDELPTPQR